MQRLCGRLGGLSRFSRRTRFAAPLPKSLVADQDQATRTREHVAIEAHSFAGRIAPRVAHTITPTQYALLSAGANPRPTRREEGVVVDRVLKTDS